MLCVAQKTCWDVFPFPLFPEITAVRLPLLLLRVCDRLSLGSLCVWSFLGGKVHDDKLNFFNNYKAIPIFCFTLCKVW